MEHHFNVEIAIKYGVNIAIFLNNMSFWIQKNIANNKNFFDGKYWTYNSVKAYSILFPYLTLKQIRTVIDQCVKKGLIIKGNYNSNIHDRTAWYCFTEKGLKTVNLLICPTGQIDLPHRANRSAPEGKCTYTDIKTDIKTERESDKRFALSAVDNFDLKSDIKSFLVKNGLDENLIKCAFKNYYEDSKRKTFKVSDLENWAIREINYCAKINKSNKKETKSTVKERIPNIEIKTGSKKIAETQIKAIMEANGLKKYVDKIKV